MLNYQTVAQLSSYSAAVRLAAMLGNCAIVKKGSVFFVKQAI
jgi:hypothetical protein